MATEITENGFVLETADDKLTRFQEQFQEYFGSKIDLSEEAIAGRLCLIDTANFQDMDLLAQALSSMIDPDSAQGIWLDFVCSLTGVSRLVATATSVKVSCRGTDGVQIAVGTTGKTVMMSQGQKSFTLDEDVTLASAEAVEAFITVATTTNETDYTISLDDTDYTYTSDSDATEQEIITGLIALINAATQAVATQENTTITVTTYDNETPFAVTVSSNLSLDEVGTLATFTCEDTGAVEVPISYIDTIVTPVSGWSGVYNLTAGTTGRARETDDELRVRREENIQSTRSGTEQGIENSLYEVDNVSFAKVTSNRESTTDSDGVPAYRYHAIVRGGTDQDILDALVTAQPAGIKSYGNTEGTAVDHTGTIQTLYFSRPVTRYVWLKVTLEVNSSWPTTGEDQLGASVESDAASMTEIGEDGNPQDFYSGILGLTGVVRIDSMTAASSLSTSPEPDPGDYDAGIIAVAATEVLDFSADRITVSYV